MELFRLLILVSCFATAAKAQALRCKEGEDKSVLFVNFDDKSAETGWTLDCDGTELLNTPSGSLGEQEAGSWYTDAVCIPTLAVCALTITGDGDSDRKESYFAMRRGNETVAFGKLPRVADVYWFGDEFMMEENTSSPSNESSEVDEETGGDSPVARVSSKADCVESETKAVLFVNFDDKSLETGWTMTCDDDQLLDVSIGSLDEEAGSWFSDMACIPDTSTCTLTLLGEGGSSRKDSYFVLKHGNDTIAYGTLPRESETVCVGLACRTSSSVSQQAAQSSTAPVLSEVVSCMENETRASLFINFDDKSAETGWTLDCDGEIVLHAPVGYFELEAGTWHSETACVSDGSTCLLTFLGGDGSSRKDSYFVLIHGTSTVDYGALPNESESFCFGGDCSKESSVSSTGPNTETPAVAEVSPATPMVSEPVMCQVDEGEVDLFVFFDDLSSETGWGLACDGAEVFSSPVGSLQQEAASWYTKAVCISDSSTCTFTLIGAGGSSRKGSYYVLRHDSKTVHYDTLPTELESFCFGADCEDDEETDSTSSPPITTEIAAGCDDEEIQATLFINFDDRSLESGWSMECDGVKLLDVPIGTLAQEPGSWYTQSSCTSGSSSCSLTMLGTGGSPRTGSFFLLRHGNSTVSFDTLPQETERYCFGVDCDDVESFTGDAVTPGSSMQEIADSSSNVEGEESVDSNPEASRTTSTLSPTISPTKVPSSQPSTETPSSAPTSKPPSLRPTAKNADVPTLSSSVSRPDEPTRVSTHGSSPEVTMSPTFEGIRQQQTGSSQASAAEGQQADNESRISGIIRSRNFYIMLVVITVGFILQIVVCCCMRAVQRKRQDEVGADHHYHGDEDNNITVHHGNHGGSLLDDDDSLFQADNG